MPELKDHVSGQMPDPSGNSTTQTNGHPMITRRRNKDTLTDKNVVTDKTTDKTTEAATQTEGVQKRKIPFAIITMPKRPRLSDYKDIKLDDNGSDIDNKDSEDNEGIEYSDEEEEDELLEKYSDKELNYYHTLPEAEQTRILDLEKQVRSLEFNDEPLRFRILRNEELDKRLKAMVLQKLDTLSELEPGTGEYAKMATHVNALTRIPMGKYKQMPITMNTSTPDKIGSFLAKAKAHLDDAVYGQPDIKKQFIMTLAKWIANPSSKGLVIGIEGPPGVGKTTLVQQGLCKALELPYVFVPLGGANDASYLDGHSLTYEGSTYGKIAEALMSCNYMNPVLCFDELDKVADNYRGNEIFNVLTHLTDYSQNELFQDKYFADTPLDMSRSIMVFTYNDASKVPPVLRDRMVCLTTVPYNTADKLAIMNDYVMPKVLDAHGMRSGDIIINKEIMTTMIQRFDSKGLRDVKRGVECIISNINMLRMLPSDMQREYMKDLKLLDKDTCEDVMLPFNVGRKHMDAFLRGSTQGMAPKLDDMVQHIYL